MPVTREQLDAVTAKGCQHPDCDCNGGPMYLHCKDHPHGDCEVSYVHGSGVLVIGCAVCHETVVNIAVGQDPRRN